MNRNERVLEIVRREGMNYSDFARRIGVSKHQFSNWKNKNQSVPEKYLVAIIEQFPDVNARWLITGEEDSGEDIKKIQTFEEYKERFERSYKETIEMLKSIVEDKERIIKLKDDVNKDLREMMDVIKTLREKK